MMEILRRHLETGLFKIRQPKIFSKKLCKEQTKPKDHQEPVISVSELENLPQIESKAEVRFISFADDELPNHVPDNPWMLRRSGIIDGYKTEEKIEVALHDLVSRIGWLINRNRKLVETIEAAKKALES